MSATAPDVPPNIYLDVLDVGSGKPVRGSTWRNAAEMVNWIVARGTTLIPGTAATCASNSTNIFRYWVYGDDWHSTRVWLFSLGPADFNQYASIETDPCHGTITVNGNDYPFSFQGTPHTVIAVEDYSVGRDPDPSAGASAGEEISFTVVVPATSHAVEIHNAQCFEAPKRTLEADSEGVDLSTYHVAREIFAESVAEVGMWHMSDRLEFARRMVRRGGMFAWNGGSVGVGTTSASYVAFFPFTFPLQTRNTTEKIPARRTVKVHVWGDPAVGDVGRVRLTMSSGDSVELEFTDGDGAWVSGDLDVSVDVPSATSGAIHRFGGTDGQRDLCTVEYKRHSGSAGTFRVHAVCISDPCGI